MVRLARRVFLYDGCYAHVISRSIRKLKLYRDDEDFRWFLKLMREAKQRFGFEIYHYCLMQTHFHAAVRIPDVEKFSKAVQFLKSRYSYKFHEKYRLSGPIWRERFKSLLIEDENYLYVCGEYIERNPVKAGLVKTPSDWKYSSSRYYQTGETDAVLDHYNDAWSKREVDVCLDDEDFFENGQGIGSAFFRLQLKQKIKGI
jgi:REP element-mobilizing transposase RayT